MTVSYIHGVPPLLEYITRISPNFDPPYHLAEYCAVLERASVEPLRIICTYPWRHYKTETTLHGVLRMLEVEPTLRIVVLCHSHGRAIWMGKRLRELAARTKVGPARGFNTIEDWQNDAGGGVVVMSAEQSKEGYDCHVLLCDDPLDEHGAESQDKRDAVDRAIAYYTARCMRRGKPGPVIIAASRQDIDDPAGRRLKRLAQKWEHKHQPAIIDLGLPTERAFAPNVWPLAELKKVRDEYREVDAHERVFWSRLQGQPRPHALSAFGQPHRYMMLPSWPGHRDALGLDMSFSRAKRADHAAIVVTRWWRTDCYIREVRRFKADLGDLATNLTEMRKTYGRIPIFTYTSGPERAAVIHLQMLGFPVNPIHTSSPKFVRAQRTIDDHNRGKILWPSEPWVDHVMGRLEMFRGNEDDPDDEADALVSVHDAYALGASGGTRSLGSWRY